MCETCHWFVWRCPHGLCTLLASLPQHLWRVLDSFAFQYNSALENLWNYSLAKEIVQPVIFYYKYVYAAFLPKCLQNSWYVLIVGCVRAYFIYGILIAFCHLTLMQEHICNLSTEKQNRGCKHVGASQPGSTDSKNWIASGLRKVQDCCLHQQDCNIPFRIKPGRLPEFSQWWPIPRSKIGFQPMFYWTQWVYIWVK